MEHLAKALTGAARFYRAAEGLGIYATK